MIIANIAKWAVLGLRQFLATENPLKMMIIVFYFILSFFLFWKKLNLCFACLAM